MTVRDGARPYLAALAGVRFFAAIHVAIFHVCQIGFLMAVQPSKDAVVMAPWARQVWDLFNRNPVLLGIAKTGYCELSLFFILSGFILAYSHPVGPAGQFDSRGYFIHRAARILPMYYFSLFFSLPVFIVFSLMPGSPVSRPIVIAALILVPLLLHAWSPLLAVFPWNPPSWSLSVEAFAYLAFPWATIRAAASTTRTVMTFAVACWIASLAAPIAYMALNPDHLPTNAAGLPVLDWATEGPVASQGNAVAHVPLWANFVRYNPILRLPEFLLGVVMGRLFADRAAQKAHVRRNSGGWILFACVLALLAIFTISDHIPYILLHNGLLSPIFAIAIVALAMGGGWIGRFCASRPIVLLGESAYGIYMLHYTILLVLIVFVLADFKDKGKPFPDPFGFVLFYLLLTVAIAVGARFLVERPGRYLVKRVLSWVWRPKQRELVRPLATADSIARQESN